MCVGEWQGARNATEKGRTVARRGPDSLSSSISSSRKFISSTRISWLFLDRLKLQFNEDEEVELEVNLVQPRFWFWPNSKESLLDIVALR